MSARRLDPAAQAAALHSSLGSPPGLCAKLSSMLLATKGVLLSIRAQLSWRPLLPAALLGGLVLVLLVPQAFAGQPPPPSLNPPPPSFLSCKTAGNQTICEGSRTVSEGPEGTGIICGSGASAFEIFDQSIFRQHAKRVYDQNGDLILRVIHQVFTFGQWSNPLTGATLPYTQTNNITDVLAVPGDFSSATETQTGEGTFTVPGMGAIILSSGRTVVGADGTLEFEAGPQYFFDDFDNLVLKPACAALGAT
jgi:hypothetical protein